MDTTANTTDENGKRNPDAVRGVMLTSISNDSIVNAKDVLNRKAYIMEVIMIVAILALAIVLSQVLTKPFNRVTQAINAVREGFSDETISVPDYVETVHIVDAFNQLLKRMKALDDSRQEFVANVSHELKTPMTSIKVLADSLLAQEDAPAELYREFMEDIIRRRKRLMPVRIELSRELDEDIVKRLCKYMDIERKYVFRNQSPLDLSFIFELQDHLRQKTSLFYPKRVPQKSAQFVSGKPILDQIKEGDKLLAYPFDSIKPFLNMLHEAAADPDVVSIKMTLYRVAKNSEVVNALIEAAENGKHVLVLVELKARFDEENNIEWSRRLEAAGCTVIYGLNGYKVHSKLCLITKNSNGNPEYYTQIGTGNYNEKTSRIYTDLSLMTADSEIGRNANDVFTALASDTTVKESEKLLVAPNCLQNRVVEMIEEQIALVEKGEEAYIGVKINSLTDKTIIDELVKASRAGVKIELAVRGICCLIPEVPGETENIRVISIVGRFLEHSRIYIFGKGEAAKIYIASADFMTRNTLRRVEVAAPIYDERLRKQIISMFDTIMSDNVQARELKSNGDYIRVENDNVRINSQELFYERAYEQAK